MKDSVRYYKRCTNYGIWIYTLTTNAAEQGLDQKYELS